MKLHREGDEQFLSESNTEGVKDQFIGGKDCLGPWKAGSIKTGEKESSYRVGGRIAEKKKKSSGQTKPKAAEFTGPEQRWTLA